MRLFELSRYYDALSSQAYYMESAIVQHEYGHKQDAWYCLLLWAQYKHKANEIADAHDTESFARALGMAYGVKKAWE